MRKFSLKKVFHNYDEDKQGKGNDFVMKKIKMWCLTRIGSGVSLSWVQLSSDSLQNPKNLKHKKLALVKKNNSVIF
jgi:hypothetical protein